METSIEPRLSEPESPPSAITRQTIAWILLALGILAWALFVDRSIGTRVQIIGLLVVVVGVARSSTVRGWFDAFGTKLQQRPCAAACALGAAAATYLLIRSAALSDVLLLQSHDEQSYMIQMQMLAKGRLWLPTFRSDLIEFFDTFHVLVRPVYASIYFPGTALLMLPTIWLKLPFWIMPSIYSGIAVGVMFLVAHEVFGGIRAFVATIAMACVGEFVNCGSRILSETPQLLCEMMILLAWLRWRRGNKIGWAFLIGAASGLAAITRPVESVCFCAVVGAAMLVELRRQRLNVWIKSLVPILLSAAPFLTLQLYQNIGTTGKWSMFPTDLYVQQFYPGPMIGFHDVDPKTAPQPTLVQKAVLNEAWVWSFYHRHAQMHILNEWFGKPGRRMYVTLKESLPHPFFVILLPLAALGCWNLSRRVLVLPVLLFLAFYAFYVFYMVQYLVAVAPCMIFLALMGLDGMERAWPGRKKILFPVIACSMLFLSVSSLPEFDPHKGTVVSREMLIAHKALATLPREPAVVLFKFGPNSVVHNEMVYNTEAAWPDDQMIVHAHDLGMPEDLKLIRYYARKQPDRMIYIYDRDAALRNEYPLSAPMGTAKELADRYAKQ